MNEWKKLEEAKYFLSRMVEEQSNRNTFEKNLSAFLSAARSVLQYALEEARSKPGGQAWYDGCAASNSTFKFFKGKRDTNIHIEPIQPRADYYRNITSEISFSGSLSFEVHDKDGKLIQQSSPEQPKVPSQEDLAKPKQPSPDETKYRFTDWVGGEDVLTLCQTYIQELESLVKEGIAKGFVTG